VSVDLGTLYRATLLDVRDAAGNPVQPTGLTFTVTPPDQSVVAPITPTLSMGAMGQVNYYADYLTAQEGLHRGQWAGAVPNITKTDYFNVTSYRALLSLDDVKADMGIHDTRHDDTLRAVIAGATGLVEEKCGTCVFRQVTNEFIGGGSLEVMRLPSGPLPDANGPITITSAYSGGPTWHVADLVVNPKAATLRTRNMINFYYGPWLATYPAGRRIMPPGIIEGCQEIVWDVWAIKRGVDYDQEDPSLSEVASFEQQLAIPLNYRIPVRALAMLDPFTMPGFA